MYIFALQAEGILYVLGINLTNLPVFRDLLVAFGSEKGQK